MSQPVSKASAPRLAPPRRKARRAGSGISFAASLIRSWASTPDEVLRDIFLICCSPSATGDHRTQAARHQQGHDHVDHEKASYRGHGKEVHVASGIVSTEERRELLHLHRFPDGKSGKHNDDAGDNDTEIKKPLNRVIDG